MSSLEGHRINTVHQSSEKEIDAVLTFASERHNDRVLAAMQSRHSLIEPRSLRDVCCKLSRDLVFMESTIDNIACVMIFVNAIIIGFVMDMPHAETGVWFGVKCAFAIIFCAELVLRVAIFGWRHQYCGDSAAGNIFDSFLILTDAMDIILSLFKEDVHNQQLLILRAFRLLRFVRIFRMFKAPIFEDLRAMALALKAGFATLLWSGVFFLCFSYVVALLFRAAMGPNPDEMEGTYDPASLGFYFKSVPRSLLTTYRCSFGDCSTRLGTPILESTEQEFGAVASIALSGLLYVASVGVVNIVAAVFLERIMVYATASQLGKQRARLNDKQLWHDGVSRFIDIQLQLQEEAIHDVSGQIKLDQPSGSRKRVGYKWLSELSNESLSKARFSKELLDFSIQTQEEARQILADLDIEPQDCLSLSDILDRNKNGDIDALELITGLSRLRGPARRGDIVAVDLALQSMQERIDEIWLDHKESKHGLCKLRAVRQPLPAAGDSIGAWRL